MYLLSRHLAGAKVRVLAYALTTNHIHAVVIPKRPIFWRSSSGGCTVVMPSTSTRGAAAVDICGRAGSTGGVHLATALRYVKKIRAGRTWWKVPRLPLVERGGAFGLARGPL